MLKKAEVRIVKAGFADKWYWEVEIFGVVCRRPRPVVLYPYTTSAGAKRAALRWLKQAGLTRFVEDK
jgi:hypothetical protein